jgi:hypothetical protein
VAATEAALSQLQHVWRLAWSGTQDPLQHSAQQGGGVAGRGWPGAWNPLDPLRPVAGVGAHAKKHLPPVLDKGAMCSMICFRGTTVGNMLAGGEVR